MTWNNFWQLLAGLGIFLFGMLQLEDALKQLAGRRFKLFLRKHTDNKFSAVISGTLVTGILQSSSIVSLMVLTFVGAGVISMRNALGVILGANLGTTLNSWIVVTLGFKLDIENFSFPIIAFAGIAIILFNNYKKLHQISNFFMGFGLMFLGLAFMKGSFELLVKDFDFSSYQHLNNLTLVLIGFVITALIQASSATMVITLSALSTGAITFEMAAAIVIGSELGTTIKILIGSIGGNAPKKRVALGNVLFNVVIVLVSLILITPIIQLIYYIIGKNDPLIGLVLFQSIINFFGIILFFPFLTKFGDLLENYFLKNGKKSTAFLQNASPLLPDAAIEVLQKENLLFIHRVIHLNSIAFNIADQTTAITNPFADFIKKEDETNRTYSEKYEQVKRAEGEIFAFYQKMSEQKIEKEDFNRLNQFIDSIRNAMYSAKGIKDIRQDKNDLRDSATDAKYTHYTFIQSQLLSFYKDVLILLNITKKPERLNELIRLMENIRTDYENRMKNIYKDSSNGTMEEIDISTLLNVNREVYSSCKAIVFSIRDYLLDATGVDEFDNMPVTLIR